MTYMSTNEFNELSDDLIKHCLDTLIFKAGEYATNDRLHNFRQGTSIMGWSEPEVVFAYQLKHICSIAKMAKDASAGIIPDEAIVKEKYGDMLNYTLLGYAAMMEKVKQQQETYNNRAEENYGY